MGRWPIHCVQIGARCLGVGPDVWAFTLGWKSGLVGPILVALCIGKSRISELVSDIRGRRTGCLGPGRMSGPCSTSMARLLLLFTSSGAGCPGPGRWTCLLPLVLFIHGLGGLSVFTCIFVRVLLTPDHA